MQQCISDLPQVCQQCVVTQFPEAGSMACMWHLWQYLFDHCSFLCHLKIVFQKSNATLKSAILLLRQINLGQWCQKSGNLDFVPLFIHSMDEISRYSVFLLVLLTIAGKLKVASQEQGLLRKADIKIWWTRFSSNSNCHYRLNQSPLHSLETFPLTLRGFGSRLLGAGNITYYVENAF